jgi:hypothetical protein
MHPGAAYEGCSGMTGTAIQVGFKVGGVGLGSLTNRRTTVMTRSTIVLDAGMIKYRAGEAKREPGGMADTAILACWYMVAWFTCGECTIMAGATVIHDASMIKGRRDKACGLVAVTAITVGWHMVRWWHFSSGGCTIVARGTVINDALVIKPGIDKGRRNMAHRAILGGRNVSRVGPGIFAGRGSTIVARGTIINYAGMIKHRGGKRTGYVTDTAILVGYNVACILTNRTTRTAVMTGVTPFTHYFRTGMINKSFSEISGVMAHPAILACASMQCRIRCSSGSSRNMIHIAIMTRGTIIADTRVIENWWDEPVVSVANVTVLASWQMAWRLKGKWIINKSADMTTFTSIVEFLMFATRV